jgi:hypothetical protein
MAALTQATMTRDRILVTHIRISHFLLSGLVWTVLHKTDESKGFGPSWIDSSDTVTLDGSTYIQPGEVRRGEAR